jgi:DNA-binding LytR/AlgR family response regulator
MKVLIVEDETAAYENLVSILAETDPGIEVLGNTESIRQTVSRLNRGPALDLIFMDIHLSDGSAFLIFDKIRVETPIIFTTAYDEYAIEAFKVNSIDYLLKPIRKESLMRALDKFRKLTNSEILQYLSNMSILSLAPAKYVDKLLIPLKDQLIPVDLSEVSCFYTTDKSTCIYMKSGEAYPYAKTLEQIMQTLDPSRFIRANKQFILARDSVKNITIWFDSRLRVTLDVETPERIYVSKNKASEFKCWLMMRTV